MSQPTTETLQRAADQRDARIDWLEKELQLQKEFYESIIRFPSTKACPWCEMTGEHFRCKAYDTKGNVRSR